MVSFPQASSAKFYSLHAALLKPTRATCVAHLIHDVITLIFWRGEQTMKTLRNGRYVDRIPVGWGWGEIFRTCPDLPWWPPSFLYDGHRVILGGKETGAWR